MREGPGASSFGSDLICFGGGVMTALFPNRGMIFNVVSDIWKAEVMLTC